MIRGVYILRKSDGAIVFHKAYSQEKLDEVLVSGFLVAVSRFSSELGSGEMDSIVMKNLKFVYGAFENIMIIFYVDRDDDDQYVREDIRKIASQFLYQYGDQVSQLKGGDLSKFKAYDAELDKVIHEEAKVKIVLIGDPKVGKTTIAKSLAKEQISPNYEPSTVATIKKSTFDKFEAVVWDIPGEGIDGKGWEQLIRGAGIVFVVLDSTIENTVRAKNLASRISDAAKGVAVFAIANKQDMPSAGNPSLIERVLGVPTYGLSATSPTARDDMIRIIRGSLVIARSGKKKGDTQIGIGDEILRLKLEVESSKRDIKELKDLLAVIVRKLAQIDKRLEK
ncbi:MAG: ADP-ribosylation factor-like protein [Candidatus Atabeyarchaeum deiterrae]